MPKPPLTTSGAARILGIADGTVRQQANRGEIPVERTEGGVRLFDRTTIERLAAERAAKRRARTGSDDEAA